MKYLLISPCRNEAEYMTETLESVISQTVKPAKWIIVNDGSTDNTSIILNEYKTKYNWINVVDVEDRGKRNVGPGVVQAFYEGLNSTDLNDYEYLCKLDLDLKLPPRYFEILMKRMQENPRIGTCSGKPYMKISDGTLVAENCDDEMSVGASKFYRTKCFLEIEGFMQKVMWDAIDCHRCRLYGWIACSWDEPELRFIHLRPMGSSQKGIITGRIRHGYGQYYMGTGLAYITASAVKRLVHPPYFIGGVATMWGYLKSMLAREERLPDKSLRRFIRHYQLLALIMGKKRAVKKINNEQLSVWNKKL
jgi:biofilm PGA synthesis N-glycosyltransferase PgaC